MKCGSKYKLLYENTCQNIICTRQTFLTDREGKSLYHGFAFRFVLENLGQRNLIANWQKCHILYSQYPWSPQVDMTVLQTIYCNNYSLTHWSRDKLPLFHSRHFEIFFFNENVWNDDSNSLNFVAKVPINNIPALMQVMAWRRPGDKPISEPTMVRIMTYICVTRPQWVTDKNYK